MRFTKNKELIKDFYNGKRKRVKKFLWFPVTIKGETRWLETATIEMKVKAELNIFLVWVYYWAPWEFID
jgi:hypothetical protein